MRSFFDPSLIERHGAAFIREGEIDKALARLIPKAHITKGHYSCPARGELRDLVWNHMDQNHRPFIHRTYGDAMRVHIGEQAAFSLTRFGNWPVVVPVFDGYYKDNGFYQVICLSSTSSRPARPVKRPTCRSIGRSPRIVCCDSCIRYSIVA